MSDEEKKFHESVLLKEVLRFFKVTPGEKYIDATLGGGGHSWEIVKRGGTLLGLDVDPDALEFFKRKLEDRGWKLDNEAGGLKLDNLVPSIKHLYPPSSFQYRISDVFLVRANFKYIDKVAKKLDFEGVSGILFDLGLSSYQLSGSKRGFSFRKNEPLDMRMDPRLEVTAADLVNNLSQEELHALFSKWGEEHLAERFAFAICRARRIESIKTASQLAEIIEKSAPKGRRIHPATKVFLALRIAVNDELNNLQDALPKAVKLLKRGGRLVIISFHSLEDREAKRLRSFENLKVETPKIIVPTAVEINQNPRARSAKMRVFTKT